MPRRKRRPRGAVCVSTFGVSENRAGWLKPSHKRRVRHNRAPPPHNPVLQTSKTHYQNESLAKNSEKFPKPQLNDSKFTTFYTQPLNSPLPTDNHKTPIKWVLRPTPVAEETQSVANCPNKRHLLFAPPSPIHYL